MQRITKKKLRDIRQGMNKRITELCAIAIAGKLNDEYFYRFPSAVGTNPPDWEKMRQLLIDLSLQLMPDHMLD